MNLEERLRNTFPKIDSVMAWYLSQVVFCLKRYVGINESEAFVKMVADKHFKYLVETHPDAIERETGYYWAMYLVHGPQWWNKDPNLVKQHVEYIREYHDPPTIES